MIQIHGKNFEPLLTKNQLDGIIDQLAEQINRDYRGKRPVFLVTLNGAFLFASDLIRRFQGDCEVAFIRMKSYDGMTSTGKAQQVMEISLSLQGRDVIIVEDLIETGITIRDLIEILQPQRPSSIHIAILLLKPRLLQVDNLPITYVGKNVGDEFLVGFGLDYNELGRNLPEIYKCVD